MAANRNYSSVARAASLTAGINSLVATIAVSETTGFPTTPFILVIDPGRTSEEAVLVTAVVGLSLTVTRGYDGTAAQAHDAGAAVRHMATAIDYREPAEHIGSTGGVHGLAGTVVGNVDSQILDNKTFTPLVTDHVPVVFKAASPQSSNLAEFRSAANAVLGFIAPSGRISTTGVDGTSSSTFTSGTSSTVGLIVKGAPSQTANVLSIRDSSNAEQIGFSAGGGVSALSLSGFFIGATASNASAVPMVITGAASQSADLLQVKNSSATVLAKISSLGVLTSAGLVTTGGATIGGTVVATGALTAPNANLTNGQTVVTTSATSQVPLIVTSPTGHTVSALAVRDQATSTSQAGIWGQSKGYQLYHGGSTGNVVPYKMYGGSTIATIQSGTTSIAGSIDYTAANFDFTPLVLLTVRQDNAGTIQRRVTANVENVPGLTSCGFRVIQTSNENVPADTTYRVYWCAIQFRNDQAVS